MKKFYDNIYIKRLNYFNIYVIRGTDVDILIDTGFVDVIVDSNNYKNYFILIETVKGK